MQSLQRLMKIGIYYPSGHSVLDRVTERFRHNLAKVAGSKPSIRFTIKNDRLYLQDIPLDTGYFFVEEFKETLASLAIKYLDIDREILPEEIHTFIQSLLIYRAKFRSTTQFVQMNLEELPFSVRIAQAEYLSAEIQTEDEREAAGSQPTLEAFLESLDKQGLSSKQLDQCRHLLESISLNPIHSNHKQNISPLITWSDVERLIISLVKKSEKGQGEEIAHSRQNLNALASILSALGKKTMDKHSLEAIDLLVSLVKKSSQETAVSQQNGKTERTGEDTQKILSTSEIELFLKEHHKSYILEKQLLQTNRCEILTIILQLLQYTHSLQVQVRIHQIIREILTTPLQKEEWRILSKGVHQLLQNQDNRQLPVTLMMIISPLRRSQHVSSLKLLEQVSRSCNPEELKKLLPFILNELLVVGRQDGPEVFEDLCNLTLYLPSSDIIDTFPVLRKLDAFMEEKIAQNLFFSMSREKNPIFAPILNTSIGKLLARRVIHGFGNTPPDWIIEALLPFLEDHNALHRKFLYEYLKKGAFTEPTTTMKTLAGQIVVQALPEVSEDKRRDLALIKTIKAMPQLKGAGITQVLESIASKKYLLVIPDWPAHCRKAAREALATLEQTTRGR